VEIAEEQGVSSRTVYAAMERHGIERRAYERAEIDPASTSPLYARGRRRERPSAEELQAAWEAAGSVRGVARQIGTAHTTAAVWLAEVGIFADDTPKISRAALLEATRGQQPLAAIAAPHGVSVTTVRVELHRHRLFEAHRTRHLSSGGSSAG
jgi:hypothetical protein